MHFQFLYKLGKFYFIILEDRLSKGTILQMTTLLITISICMHCYHKWQAAKPLFSGCGCHESFNSVLHTLDPAVRNSAIWSTFSICVVVYFYAQVDLSSSSIGACIRKTVLCRCSVNSQILHSKPNNQLCWWLLSVWC